LLSFILKWANANCVRYSCSKKIFLELSGKEEYSLYLDWALENLKKGGVVVAHNAFLYGQIVHGKDHESRVKAMRSFNDRLASDPRMIATIFPAGDGLAIGILRA